MKPHQSEGDKLTWWSDKLPCEYSMFSWQTSRSYSLLTLVALLLEKKLGKEAEKRKFLTSRVCYV